MANTLGRFELRKVLGRGAQSDVWLAFDPRMEREVAIKVMRTDDSSDAEAVAQWLAEARSVGRVKHPNIIPVFEADLQGRTPFLVFEYVEGRTLDLRLKESGAQSPPAAAALMMDVLDALAVAHTAGVVHRDIKPSNILVDAGGRARVMDFGIAGRIRRIGENTAEVVAGGTVGYLSPEAANGAEPSISMDIFSAGLVLAELLMGRPLLAEKDPNRAIYRVLHEQLALPANLGAGVDDRMRAIVARAIAQDPNQRFSSARDFLVALEHWLKPAEAMPNEASGAAAGSATLDFLLRRMRHKSDFPAMSDAIVRIQRMATSETESVGSVTTEILKDVALTNKLLRLVNSAHYSQGGEITTVSRAVSLVGFNGIRNMALSLVLLEHMQDKTHAAQLLEEFLRSMMAGTLASELCATPKEGEEAFLGAMFQNLGRMLVQFYFPEEAQQIRQQVQDPRNPKAEDKAAHSILGLSFEEVGLGVAKAWGLPTGIQRAMRKPTGTPPTKNSPDAVERTRWLATASNEVAETLLQSAPEQLSFDLDKLARKFSVTLNRTGAELQAVSSHAQQKMRDLAQAMDLRVLPGSASARMLGRAQVVQLADGPFNASATADGQLKKLELQATVTMPAELTSNATKPSNVAETLAAGIQDITNAMVDDFKLTDVLRMILETMYRALQFDRVIFCMRDPKTDTMLGRFGLGQGVESYAKMFKTPLKAVNPDLFALVCVKGADTMITDASEGRIMQRLPPWYRQSINAPTFLLLPLQIKGAPFGLIYADKIAKGTLELDEKELSLLRTLRNQAVMAFKQSG